LHYTRLKPDIQLHCEMTITQLGSQRLCRRQIAIQNTDVSTLRRKTSHGSGANPAGSTGNDTSQIQQTHIFMPLSKVVALPPAR
jgi:hypothetical protein